MGLAATPPLALGNVEDDVGAPLPEPVDDPGAGPEADHLVSRGGERGFEVPDRRLGVVLLEGVLGQVGGRVGGLYVVGEADSHRLFLRAIRSFPAGMSAFASPVMSR